MSRRGLRTWARFSIILAALSTPFWLAGSLPLPSLAQGLPVSALMAICPTMTVVLLARCGDRNERWWHLELLTGRRSLRKGSVLLVCALAMPAVVLLAAAVDGTSFDDLLDPSVLAAVLVLVVPVVVAATTEEIGWTAWLLPRLAEPWGRRRAGLVIGLTWGGWHAVPYVQAENPIPWVVGQVLFSILFRLLIIELSSQAAMPLLAAILLHATYNLAWQVILLSGMTYSPWTTATITTVVLAVLVSHRWEDRSRR